MASKNATILGGEFTYVPEDKTHVECRRCKKKFKYHHSTSSLRYHLTNYHGISKAATELSETECGSQKKKNDDESKQGHGTSFIQQTIADMGHCKISTKKANDLTLSMAMWLAKSCRPMAMCEDEGLRDLLRIATGNSVYTPPSRQTIQRRVDAMFNDCKSALQSKLDNILYTGLTCDYWTSVSNISFLGMTAHYIDDDYNLVNTTLAVDESTERHTAENVLEHIKHVVKEYKLVGKV